MTYYMLLFSRCFGNAVGDSKMNAKVDLKSGRLEFTLVSSLVGPPRPSSDSKLVLARVAWNGVNHCAIPFLLLSLHLHSKTCHGLRYGLWLVLFFGALMSEEPVLYFVAFRVFILNFTEVCAPEISQCLFAFPSVTLFSM
jgi:hypothetical protein